MCSPHIDNSIGVLDNILTIRFGLFGTVHSVLAVLATSAALLSPLLLVHFIKYLNQTHISNAGPLIRRCRTYSRSFHHGLSKGGLIPLLRHRKATDCSPNWFVGLVRQRWFKLCASFKLCVYIKIIRNYKRLESMQRHSRRRLVGKVTGSLSGERSGMIEKDKLFLCLDLPSG